MRTALVSAVSLAAACGGADQQISRRDDRGWAERMADADQHEQRASEHDQLAVSADARRGPTSFNCGDPVLNDQVTTGGLRVTTWQPCFDLAEEAAVGHRDAAQRERELARRDRRTAHALVSAELSACAGIPDSERAHSVFAHKTAISKVIPHREAGQLHGVWVEFKRVPGLSADWIRRDIDCQRARWAALGPHPTDSPEDPTLVPGAQVQVFDRGDHVDVLVTTDTTEAGEVALARAEGRLSPVSHQQTAVK
jgi:hypothetical protein